MDFRFNMKPKPYLPANGTEGMNFLASFCDKCYKHSQCTILNSSMFGHQPKQWVCNPKPCCTSFNPVRPKRKKKEVIGVGKLF